VVEEDHISGLPSRVASTDFEPIMRQPAVLRARRPHPPACGPNLDIIPIFALGVSSVHFPYCNLSTHMFHHVIDVATIFLIRYSSGCNIFVSMFHHLCLSVSYGLSNVT
jgi:hypothetical protein